MRSFLTRSVVMALWMGPFSTLVDQMVRRMHLSRTKWLADSIAYSYFWKARAKSSFVPAPGIDSASLVLGFSERPDGRGLS
jgi:hypothetical protein